MEIITILSTIILIATISTFILSVGAYILYKIRSRRELKPILKSVSPTKAELVTVAEIDDFEKLRQQVGKTIPPKLSTINSERDIGRGERRFSGLAEKQKQQRSPSSKYTKFGQEGYSSSDKEHFNGDLQWK